ncbi:Rab-like protein 3 [Lobosporangium transversale]|uniref:p-loop containing nucleoside triphosphate hydrolase protein n=1 Tax=Lobosporangium transversale TaxID=64571 RepID=A0A1Y2GCX7_9FUNG|nr:P-loop containing nucleoside triphosphate hydrolase protein [Lobosporangium transversale]KAF9917141.1 Rab-like protein 3 [Lobosporangium transversale]ORZ05558.1 P-loop containing nucleoside triphosphate hydrolase protein [Lobosporangium transversale]|eukprot:XP_021877132.1 P-loop containing nucleoside triphosphate hydrolase protein [Lobosporangium transversale]
MQQDYGQEAAVKILVLGDSGVGKSSLVHMLCHNEPLRPAIPTVGCNIDVRLHTTSTSTTAMAAAARSGSGISSLLSRNTVTSNNVNNDNNQSSDSPSHARNETFIEFYDVTGSPAVRHPKSRSMFYNAVVYQGLILVHDLCNRRSYDNLWKWIGDFLEASQSAQSMLSGGFHGGLYGQLDIPLLVVGTKTDMALSQRQQHQHPHGSDLIEKYGGEVISVCTISPTEFMPNSSTTIAFDMFFARVLEPSGSASSRSRSRNTSSHGSTVVYPSGASPIFSRPSITPSATPIPKSPSPSLGYGRQPSRQDRTLSTDSNNSSSAIPIMDFATFTGTTATSTTEIAGERESTINHRAIGVEGERARTPEFLRSDHLASTSTSSPGSSTTPTGSRNALRAQYERNRNVLSQYSNIGVPVYTGSRSHTPMNTR